MSKDGKHNKHRKNQGYLETLSNFFSTLAFKLSSDNFVCDFFFFLSFLTFDRTSHKYVCARGCRI